MRTTKILRFSSSIALLLFFAWQGHAQNTTQHFTTAAGWSTADHVRTLGDINGDGKADIVGFWNDGVYVAFSQGQSFSEPKLLLRNLAKNAGGWSVKDHTRVVGDVNGDGKADIVGFGGNDVFVALSKGETLSDLTVWLKNNLSTNHGWNNREHVRTVADVNGDGKADLVGFGGAGVFVAYSGATQAGTAQMLVNNFAINAGGWEVSKHTRLLADINGDKKADIVGFGGKVLTALSTGNNFAAIKTNNQDFYTNPNQWNLLKHRRMMADVNGDGKADIVGFTENKVYVSLSKGDDFDVQKMCFQDFTYSGGGSWRTDKHVVTMADVNGDGKDDIVGFKDDGVYVAFSNGQCFEAAKKVAFGNQEVTYSAFIPEPNAKYQIRLASDPTKALTLEAQSTYDSKGHPLKVIHLLNLTASVGNPLGFIPYGDGKYYQLHYNENRYFGVLPDESRNVGLFYGDVNPRKLFRFLIDSKGNVIIKSALNDDDKHVIGVADDGKNIVVLAQHTVTPDRMLFTLTKYIEEPPAGAPSSNTNPRPNDGKPATLFPETHTVPKTVPAMKFKLIDLVCIETQDDGSDEIVLNVWIDGKRMSIPTNGYQDMNEESETEQWMLDRAFSFTNSVKVEIREVDREISGFEDIDNSGNETIGVLELDMNSAQGDQIKSFMGPDDSHYILRFQLGNVEILPIAFFSDEHINEYVLPASKQGGSLVDSAFDEQKRAFDKLDEYFGQNKDTPTSPIASPDISPEAEIVLNQTITAVTGAIAGVCVKSGPVGWAVGGALLAVGAATFLPAYFAGQNGVLELEIANLSNQKLEIESFEMSSGKKVSGSNKGGIIPAKGGPDQTPISFFSFRKKWGMTGIVGKINFKPTPHMPKGMIVEFSTPFVGTSTCKVDIPVANGNSNAGKSAWNGMMRAYIGMDARNDLFPKIIVTLQNDTSGNK
ncbi:MAG: VCBS repeat-containing protein [Saprospiraceae bacterium]|nr:VCBS repeat-containing protein [Saprospiraceae bacterium]